MTERTYGYFKEEKQSKLDTSDMNTKEKHWFPKCSCGGKVYIYLGATIVSQSAMGSPACVGYPDYVCEKCGNTLHGYKLVPADYMKKEFVF